MDHVLWSIVLFSKNHLLEVGLTQNQETMAPQTLTTVGLFYFIMCDDPHEYIEIHWNIIWLRARAHMGSHYTRGFVTSLHDLKVCWDGLWTLSFGLSQFHDHGSWFVCEVALSTLKMIFSVVTTLSCSTLIFYSLIINVRHKCVATFPTATSFRLLSLLICLSYP
jgi:hypothetical protein